MPPEGQGRAFVLGGLPFDHDRGPVGHSDGDALLHAVTDAILGALGLEDIGQLFPDTDPAWDGADSQVFLEAARDRMERAGYRIGNLDATVMSSRCARATITRDGVRTTARHRAVFHTRAAPSEASPRTASTAS